MGIKCYQKDSLNKIFNSRKLFLIKKIRKICIKDLILVINKIIIKNNNNKIIMSKILCIIIFKIRILMMLQMKNYFNLKVILNNKN